MPTFLWYHFGPQGETRQLTNASGAVVDTYVYTAYGVPVASTGTDPNPFRFGGQVGYYTETNPQCQTVLCGARWYSPVLGRWLSRDPIGYEGGPNLYEYCGGDPANGVDPDGASWEDFKRWYHGGMGGFSGWVDRNLMLGFTGSWAHVAGLNDSGKASTGAVVWGGLKFSGMLAYNGVTLGRGGVRAPARMGLPGCAASARGAGGAVRAGRHVAGRVLLQGTAAKAVKIHVHHLLPRQFVDFFRSKGLRIDDAIYKVRMRADDHRLLHGKGGGDLFFKSSNPTWQRWIADHRDATPEAVLEQLAKMRRCEGI